MDITAITHKLAERFPECAELLQVNPNMPHSSYLINSLLHLFITRTNALERRMADLRTAYSKGHQLGSATEDLLFAEVDLQVVVTMLVPLEHGLTQGNPVAEIEVELKKWAQSSAMTTDLPRSSSMVHNARSVMELDAWRSMAREMRLS